MTFVWALLLKALTLALYYASLPGGGLHGAGSAAWEPARHYLPHAADFACGALLAYRERSHALAKSLALAVCLSLLTGLANAVAARLTIAVDWGTPAYSMLAAVLGLCFTVPACVAGTAAGRLLWRGRGRP